MTHTEGKAADCTNTGITENWTCTCGKIFADEACTKVIATAVIDALGHTRDEAVDCTQIADNGDNHTATCSVCKLTFEHPHQWADNACSLCGYTRTETPVTTTTVTKTIAELGTAAGWAASSKPANITTTGVAVDDVVSLIVEGGSNSGKYYSSDQIRVYATDSPAGSVTIKLASGYELVSIKITANTSGSNVGAELQLDGTDVLNKTVTVSGSSVTMQSVKIGSDGKQVQITAIEVVYKTAA